ncbi:MAG TPA: serine/threonine-protein kinase [Streptosporangiaceae bacterium]|jgi:hypothetical protein|nr:serine/threonine-protein kinase [Streptosporangiaceae bacterium]
MAAQNTMPERLGPYVLLEKIGEGGMGVVHLARDPQGRSVAVKVLRAAVAGDPDARRRLSREFETMRRVRSPFVAAVIDADVTGEVPYVVTRYVAGPSLDQMVAATGPLRGQALERLAWGLAEGLAAVHAAGVVHRDLKPGNVVLQGGVPVLIDFGIAHAPDVTKITQVGMFMGTPGYLAPEVVEGQPSGPSADVHSWASTVAFAATGRPPYGTGSYETIFYRILSGKPDLAGVPSRLLPMLTAAISRDPDTRPSAVQLSKECAAVDLSGPDTAADPLATPGVLGATAMAGQGTVLDQSEAAVKHWNQQMQAAGGANGYAPQASGSQATQAPGSYADLLPPVSYAAGVYPGGSRSGTGAMNGKPPPTAAGSGHIGFKRLLTLLTVGIGVGVSVLLPVAGPLAFLILIVLLRTADLAHSGFTRRRSAQGARATDVPVMIIKTPWAVLRALFGSLLLAPLAATCGAIVAAVAIMSMHVNPLPAAGAFAAGAFVACYGYGPGSDPPRRQLGRFFGVFARGGLTRVVVPVVLAVLLVATVAAAATQSHVLWPLSPGLAGHLATLHHAVQRLQVKLPHF